MSKTKCKNKNCKHNASRPSGFCGWCDRKYQKGDLLFDGRERDAFCKVSECNRAPKTNGFCGWCFKKYEKGELDFDGGLTVKALSKIKKQKDLAEKKQKRAARNKTIALKKALKASLNKDRLKALQVAHPHYKRTIHCPHFNITICPASCFGRMFVHDLAPSKCRKCEVHNNALEGLKEEIESL